MIFTVVVKVLISNEYVFRVLTSIQQQSKQL